MFTLLYQEALEGQWYYGLAMDFINFVLMNNMNTEKQLLASQMNKHGFVIFLIGMAFALGETIYFGSNWLPESVAEFKCDVLSAKIVGSGWGLMIYAWYLRLNN